MKDIWEGKELDIERERREDGAEDEGNDNADESLQSFGPLFCNKNLEEKTWIIDGSVYTRNRSFPYSCSFNLRISRLIISFKS